MSPLISLGHVQSPHVAGQSLTCDAAPWPEGTRMCWFGRAGHDYSGVVIRARGVEKRYGDKRVLRGVEFDVAADGFLLVTGPNGSGKTTLLRLCAGPRDSDVPASSTSRSSADASATSRTSRSSTAS